MSDKTYAERSAQYVRELGVYYLAGLADCMSPDSSESAGASFLTGVRESVAEAIEYAEPEDSDDLRRVLDGDAPHEIADGAPNVYTGPRWAEFVDLGAYQEDLADLGGIATSDDLTTLVAGVALYIIAERLVVALIEDAAEMITE